MRTRLLVSLLGLGLAACANGGGGGGGASPGDGGVGGGDAPSDGAANGDAQGDGPAGEGGSGTSAVKACDDNAASYCAQLATCSNFLLNVVYGDQTTCEARIPISCMDALQAPGTGWTGDKLEACITARTALDCTEFLYGKPSPSACLVTGTLTNADACRYSAQCGTGYCRITGSSQCGNCVALGATGAPCTTSADCDGNLLCAGNGTCQPPQSVNSACSSTQPCQQGLACLGGVCTQPGELGATCSAANNGADCDGNQGVYCDTTSGECAAELSSQPGGTCGGAIPTACQGGSTCSAGTCVPPATDGTTCDPAEGENCLTPETCNGGGADAGGDAGQTCGLFTAAQCK